MSTNNQNSVSVVISAYRDGDSLIATVDSVFKQLDELENKDLILEVIIVDDGADQSVKEALSLINERYSKYELVLLSQKNKGLTKALQLGCQSAKHAYISRIDVGDIMLPTRLRQQIDYLNNDSSAVAVATWVNIVTKEGYPIYQVKHTDEEVRNSLTINSENNALENFSSPQHYTMMMRKQEFEKVGGYREEFYYAQDVDLWFRLRELGLIRVIEKVLTDEIGLLAQAKIIRPKQNDEVGVKVLKKHDKLARFKSLYFIAKCLLDNKHSGARKYFIKALQQNSLSLKAMLGLLRSLLIKGSQQ